MVVDLCHVRQDGPRKFTASNVEYEHRAGCDRRSRLRNSQTFQECTTGNGRGKVCNWRPYSRCIVYFLIIIIVAMKVILNTNQITCAGLVNQTRVGLKRAEGDIERSQVAKRIIRILTADAIGTRNPGSVFDDHLQEGPSRRLI
jgi:hypothetical protein